MDKLPSLSILWDIVASLQRSVLLTLTQPYEQAIVFFTKIDSENGYATEWF